MNRWAGHLVFLFLFAVYVSTSAPAVTWFDTGELAAGAFLLGNGHPPGQPLYVLLGKGATLVPVGSIAFRLAVLSALCSATAVILLTRVVRRLCARLGYLEVHWSVSWLLVPVAAGLALPVWLQAVRVELYATQLLLSVATVALVATGPESPRSRLVQHGWVGLVVGLSAATHPLLGALLLPGLLIMADRILLRSLIAAIGAGLVGVSALVYLPVRARADALLNWGDPATWERFWFVATGKAYQHSFATLTAERLLDNLHRHGALFLGLLGAPLLVLAALGLIISFKRPRVGAGLVLLLGGNVASTALQATFFPDNPDALGYLALSTTLLVVMSAIGVTWLQSRLKTLARAWNLGPATRAAITGAMVLSASAIPPTAAWPRADLHDNWNYERYIHLLLRPLPPGTLLLSSSDAPTFAGWYGQAVEGLRPDIGQVSLYTLSGGTILAVGNLPTMPELPSATVVEQTRALLSHNRNRPLHMTMHDLPIDLSDRMRIDVTTFRIDPHPEGVPLDDGLLRLDRFWRRLASSMAHHPAYLKDRQARLRFPSHVEAVGDHLRNLGLLDPAVRAYRVAELLAPDAHRLVHLKRARTEELARNCGSIDNNLPGGRPPGPHRLLQALRCGNRDQARAFLQVEDKPLDSPESLLARAWLAYLDGRWREAQVYLERLRSTAPVGPEAETALIRLNRVLPTSVAVAWMEQYLQKTRSAPVAATLAGRLLEQGRVDTALKLARSTVTQAPRLVAAHVALGWALVSQGDLEQAFQSVSQALALEPTDPEALRLSSYLYRRGLR